MTGPTGVVGRRLMAYAIDLALIAVLGALLALVAPGAVWLSAVVAGLVYFVVLEALGGTTLGKVVLRLAVTTEDGSTRIGTGPALIRNAIRVVDSVLIGLPVASFTRRNQRLGDLAARTFVVDEYYAGRPLFQASDESLPMLEANDVTKAFGGLVAVDSIDFEIPRRSIVSIIGPNGAGKTTFFNILTGLYEPTVGDIYFDGGSITGRRPDLILSFGVSRTFQNIRLFGTMSAVENVLVGEHARTRAGLFGSILRPPHVTREEREARDKARFLLEYVGLDESVFDEAAANLSYGDQRRLELARALGSDPKLLLLDEPTAGMNRQESSRLTNFMETLRDERGLTILLIEHDMKVVMDVSERITVLDHGEKIAEGPPGEVRADPRVVEAYLGKEAA